MDRSPVHPVLRDDYLPLTTQAYQDAKRGTPDSGGFVSGV